MYVAQSYGAMARPAVTIGSVLYTVRLSQYDILLNDSLGDNQDH